MKRPRQIHLQNQSRSRKLRYKAGDVRALFHTLDDSGLFDPPDGELSVVFLDDAQICRLHADFMNDPSPTDVITFPGHPAMDFAGEICVSAERAFSFAERKAIDFSRELTLYLVHGYLHLAGHDDTDAGAKRKMRHAERKALSLLENSGKIPTFILSNNQT